MQTPPQIPVPSSPSGCPRCGQAPDPGDRFCAACGHALPRPAPDATLGDQQLTVLHVELRGAPELTGALAPEELARLLEAFHETVDRACRAQGGFVNQRLGESAIALFGLGGDVADGANRAMEAAVTLLEGVRQLGGDVALPRRLAVHARAGLDCGRVRTGPGDGVGGVMTVAGEVQHTAARLRARAGDDEVWVGPSALAFVAERFEVEATEPLPGGAATRGNAYRVVGRRPTSDRTEGPLRPPLVGRDWERATLLDALRGVVSDRRPALLLVEGPRGEGKTRLLEAFSREAPGAIASTTAVRGLRVWSATCAPPPVGQTAFGPFRELLRRAFGPEPGVEPLAEALGPGPRTAERAALLADLAGPFRPAAVRPAAREDHGEPRAAAIRDALAALLAATATPDRPLLLLLDDWHWADRGARTVLRQTMEAAHDRPILLVLASRLGGSAVSEVDAFAGLEPQRLTLEPLPAAAFADLLGSGDDAAEAARLLAERSHGSPLLAVELLRWALDRAPRDPDAVDGPSRVRAALAGELVPANAEGLARTRLEALDEESRDVLGTASALGARFPRTLLERVWGRSASLDRALDRLVDRGWLHADPHVEGYAFDHGMLREVAHAELDPARRLDLHQRALDALGSQATPALAALHAEEAGRPERAAEAAGDAGDAALDAGDGELARAWYGRALERLEVLPATPERRRAWIEVALRWVAMHPVANERHQLAIVRECHARAMDRGLLPQAVEALRLESALELARGRVDDALSCLERCLRLVGWQDRDARASLYVWLGRAWAAATELGRAEAFLEDALQLRETARGAAVVDDATAIEATIERGSIRLDLGDLQEARRLLSTARDRAAAAGRRSLEAQAWARLVVLHLTAHELPAARTAAGRIRAIGERAASPHLRWLGEALEAVADAHAEGPAAAPALLNALDDRPSGRPLRSPSFDEALFADALAQVGEIRLAIKHANVALTGATRRDTLGECAGHRALGLSLAATEDGRGPAEANESLRRSAELGDARGQLLEVAWSRFRLAERTRRREDVRDSTLPAVLVALRELGVTPPLTAPQAVPPESGVRHRLPEPAVNLEDVRDRTG